MGFNSGFKGLSIRAYFAKYIFIQAPYFWPRKTRSPTLPPEMAPKISLILNTGRYGLLSRQKWVLGGILGMEGEKLYA